MKNATTILQSKRPPASIHQQKAKSKVIDDATRPLPDLGPTHLAESTFTMQYAVVPIKALI